MPRTLGRFLPLLLLPLGFVFSLEVHADPLVITSGHITFGTYGSNSNSFALEGEGLSLHGVTTYMYAGRIDPDSSYGGVADFSKFYIAPDPLALRAPFTAGGVMYSNDSSDSYHFSVQIFAPAFPFPDPFPGLVTFDTTFTMEAHLSIYSGDTRVFSTILIGQGIASATYSNGGTFTLWHLISLNYSFQTTPTPEPATLLLLGSGLAGITTKAYRRRKVRTQN